MKLRTRFTLFAVLIHIVLLGLSLLLLTINKYYFVGAELLILVSILMSVRLYRSFLRPLDLISVGVETIKSRDFTTKFKTTGQEDLDNLIDVYNSMIVELRSERVKQQQQHFFLQRLINAAPSGIIILDWDEKIKMINPAARAILGTGADNLIGQSLDGSGEFPISEMAELMPGESKLINFNGIETYRCSKSRFVDRGFHRHFILIEELTKEIMVSQKSTYEKVIRMMSHEINNSVGAVNSILDSALSYSDQLTPDDRQDFEQATRVAIDRNNGLNKFMSNFAAVVRIPLPIREDYDLHELLKSVEVLMSSTCSGHNVKWQRDLCGSPLMVHIDVQQMEQVLVNIVKNAIEAMGEGGTLTVVTSAGNPKTVRIVDTGKGISAENRKHLFAPFYSTKKDGQGIGLTLVREVLVNHGFSFNLQTIRPGQTEFSINFGNGSAV